MLIKKSRDRIFQPHHTLSLFQTLSPNVHKCLKPYTLCWNSFPASPQLLFSTAHFWGYFHLRRHIQLRRHIYTRTAPNLFLTKTTKLTSHGTSRCPASSSYPIRSPTATLYQKKPTRVFGRLWKLFLPEPIDHILVVLSYVVCFVWFLSESCLCPEYIFKNLGVRFE